MNIIDQIIDNIETFPEDWNSKYEQRGYSSMRRDLYFGNDETVILFKRFLRCVVVIRRKKEVRLGPIATLRLRLAYRKWANRATESDTLPGREIVQLANTTQRLVREKRWNELKELYDCD